MSSTLPVRLDLVRTMEYALMPSSVGTRSMLPLAKSPSTTSGLPITVALGNVRLLMNVTLSMPGSVISGGLLLIIHTLWSSAKARASLPAW